MEKLAASIEKHYSEWPTFDAILENLKRKGVDLKNVRPQDLYPYDQSHAGGLQTTTLLAERAGIQPHDTVIDVGCGTGGAARYLHAEFSCRVVGIDLTPARLRAGMEFNRLIGVAEGICFIASQADAMPLPSRFADVVWTQHVTMNLPDHTSFVRECARVLKPSGRLACHEWFLKRPGTSALPFPMPWAPEPAMNHAISSEEFLHILREENFSPEWEDVTLAMEASLRRDVRLMVTRTAPAERIAARENLLEAISNGLLHCLMIIARL